MQSSRACRYHPDRDSTHVVDIGKSAVCDECAERERENGLLVWKHSGFLWGFPVRVAAEDILDAEVIDYK